jgi:transcriptional regulator GlxA family with amidase domain
VRPRSTTHVDLLLTDGCFHSGLAVTLDVLETANLLARGLGVAGAPFRSRVLSVGRKPVRSSAGQLVAVDGDVGSARPEVVIAFGPGMADAGRVLRDVARADAGRIIEGLRRLHGRGAHLAASCSSTFLLAESGILSGRRATTSWWLAQVFAQRYQDVTLCPEELVVETANATTAGAAMAQLDLALVLVRRYAGPAVADAVSAYLTVSPRRSQAPYLVVEHLARADALVARASDALRERLTSAPSLEELARQVGSSTRTLSRRFVASTGMSYSRYLRRLRVEAAAARLRAGDDEVGQVSARVGYEDERAFRRAFQKELGVTPAAYRRGVRHLR